MKNFQESVDFQDCVCCLYSLSSSSMIYGCHNRKERKHQTTNYDTNILQNIIMLLLK